MANASRLFDHVWTVLLGNIPLRWLTSAETVESQVVHDEMTVLPRFRSAPLGPVDVFAEAGISRRM